MQEVIHSKETKQNCAKKVQARTDMHTCATLKSSLGWRSYGVFRLRLPAALPKAKYIISRHCWLTCYSQQDCRTWWWHDMASPYPQTHIRNI